MVMDAPVSGPGDGAQFGAAVPGFQRLDLLGPVVDQPLLEVDARERRGQLPQVRRRRSH